MNKKQKSILLRIIIGLLLFAAGFIVRATVIGDAEKYVSVGLFLASLLISGFDVIIKAFRNIFKGQLLDENFLMVVATIGAAAIGEFPEGAAVMLFFQIGELFQSIAVGKSRKSITDLMDLCPDTANVLRDGKIEVVDPFEVEIGESIVIKPGEKVPLDAIIVEGRSSLDTSSLTGESIPREVEPGREILSGSVNLSGVLTAKVEKEFDESTANKILELVENAADNKSKSEEFITKFARWYTPTVVVAALVIAILPSFLIEGASFKDWIYRALTFLVISCPCALVISVPLSFFGGIGACSKAGVLVKGSNFLESLSKVSTAVFDKTGTLTKGNFAVTAVKAFGCSEEELLETAVAAESFSNHPISISLREYYPSSPERSGISDYIEVAGHGIKAVIDGKQVLAGNENLMKVAKIEYTPCSEIGTVVYVAKEERFLGFIVISDEIKESSKAAIADLKKAGVKSCVMLTGDNERSAKAVAKEVGIDRVFSELLPQHKVEKIEMLISESRGGKVLFVGDGINDAPSLALADVGVAMGGVGSDAAIEAADLVIMNDELTELPTATRIARKTLRIAKENIVFALAVKLVVLILGAIGIAPMWLAIFADVGVAVIAILNAMRCMRLKRNK